MSQHEQKAKKRCQPPFQGKCQPPFTLSVSRRHFLRGMGVALALPWMESLPVFGQAAEAVKANTPPLRLGIVFFSNGVEPTEWWAKGSGANMQLGPAALPMMPHREDMVFIQGLYNQTAAASSSPHLGRMNVLSG